MSHAGKSPAANRRRRPWLLLTFLASAIIIFITCIIIFGYVKFSPPHFQVESISISFDDNNNVSKWAIFLSFYNPNLATLRYRMIDVTVGGRRPQSSTVSTIVPPSKHTFHGQSSRNATVYVALPSPRPPLSVDGAEFYVLFQTEYSSPPGRRAAAAVTCGDKNVQLLTSKGGVATVQGPVRCEVVSSYKIS